MRQINDANRAQTVIAREWWFYGNGGSEVICSANISPQDALNIAYALRDGKSHGITWGITQASEFVEYSLDVFDDRSIAIARQSPDPAGLFYSPGEFGYENYHYLLGVSVCL